MNTPYHILLNTTHIPHTYEFYLPHQCPAVDEPFLAIQEHYLSPYQKTNLDNIHEMVSSHLTTYRLLKSYADLLDSSDPTNSIRYSVEYSLFNDPKLMDLYRDTYQELFELEPSLQNLTRSKLTSLIKSNKLPQPPRKIIITRSDGQEFTFSQVSTSIIYKLKYSEQKKKFTEQA